MNKFFAALSAVVVIYLSKAEAAVANYGEKIVADEVKRNKIVEEDLHLMENHLSVSNILARQIAALDDEDDDEGGIIVAKDEHGNIKITKDPADPFDKLSKTEASANSHREARQAVKEDDPTCLKRWPNAKIPYRFDRTEHPLLDGYDADLVNAMSIWEANTCLRFEDISDNSSRWNDPHFIIKSERGQGCWAIIGRCCNCAGQTVNIDSGCNGQSVAMHEIGHGIGLFHQHVRPDRNQYLTVLNENVPESVMNNFVIPDSETLDTPYDYTSVMHYGKTSFSTWDKPVILTKNPLLQYLIGHPPEASHYDYMLVNKMYNCADHCVDPPTCQNGGFVNASCSCSCPHNTEGDLCETKTGEYYPKMYGTCDGEQTIETDAVIKSLNYPNTKPSDPQSFKCQWYLKAPKGKKAQVTFDDFRLYEHASCKIDCMDIMYDLYNIDERKCGTSLQGQTITATKGSLMIIYASRTPGWNLGFQASVKFIDDIVPTKKPISKPKPKPGNKKGSKGKKGKKGKKPSKKSSKKPAKKPAKKPGSKNKGNKGSKGKKGKKGI